MCSFKDYAPLDGQRVLLAAFETSKEVLVSVQRASWCAGRRFYVTLSADGERSNNNGWLSVDSPAANCMILCVPHHDSAHVSNEQQQQHECVEFAEQLYEVHERDEHVWLKLVRGRGCGATCARLVARLEIVFTSVRCYPDLAVERDIGNCVVARRRCRQAYKRAGAPREMSVGDLFFDVEFKSGELAKSVRLELTHVLRIAKHTLTVRLVGVSRSAKHECQCDERLVATSPPPPPPTHAKLTEAVVGQQLEAVVFIRHDAAQSI